MSLQGRGAGDAAAGERARDGDGGGRRRPGLRRGRGGRGFSGDAAAGRSPGTRRPEAGACRDSSVDGGTG